MQEVKRMDDVWRLVIFLIAWIAMMIYLIKKGEM